MIRTSGALALIAAAALLAACQSTPVGGPTAGAPVESRSVPPPGSGGATAGATPGGATASATPQSQVASVDAARGGAGAAGAGAALAAPAQRIVYFDFDSFVIRDEFKPLIDGHAKVLAAQPGRKLVVEGHTDERGSREYNLALGQKRAESVVRSLTLLGVQPGQLEAVSFGEERPAATGSDESAWAKNRRAELKDR
jgi:peptidoglycan-associated lipoprotein